MQYQVTGCSFKQKSDGSGFVGSQTISIDETRYISLKEAKENCLLAVGIEERFQLVIENYREWETELLSYSQSFLLWGLDEHNDAMQKRLCLDRRLVNVLTAFRLYLDQTDKTVSNTFGENSSQLDQIRKFRSSLYDTYFGYRFLEVLRDYVQHRGLPVQILTIEPRLIETKSGKQTQCIVIPQITLEVLATDKKIKKPILDELKSFGEKIDLRLPVREYVSCIVKLHGELRKAFSEMISHSMKIYSEAIKEYSTINGHEIELLRLQCVNDSGFVTEQIAMIGDILTLHELLHKRNSSLTLHAIATSSVSNTL